MSTSTRSTEPRYLVMFKGGSSGVFTVTELTESDLEIAEVGLADIVRLADLVWFKDGEWVPVPPGILTQADEEISDQRPFHVPPDFESRQALD